MARFFWEFLHCSDETSGTHILFILLLIILQCTGPRLECILLSIIYGIAENTVSPNTLYDVMTDMTCLRYFKEFCAQNEGADILLYFWFDVMRAKVALKKKTEIMTNMQNRSFTDHSSDPNDSQANDVEFYGQKVRQYVREICANYMSESGPLSLNQFHICSNRERNAIRTFVLQLKWHTSDGSKALEHSDDEDFDEEIDDDNGEVHVRAASQSQSSDNSSDSDTSALFDSHDSLTQGSGIGDSRYLRMWRSKKKAELRKLEEERRLVRMLGKSQLVAYRKLEQLMASFRGSNMFQEMCHVLRMRAVSNQRSLYRDLMARLSTQLKKFVGEIISFLSRPRITSNMSSMAGLHTSDMHIIAGKTSNKFSLTVNRSFDDDGRKKRWWRTSSKSTDADDRVLIDAHLIVDAGDMHDGAGVADQKQSVEAFESISADMYAYIKEERDKKRNELSFMTF